MENNQSQLLNEEDFEKLRQRGISEAEIETLKESLGLVEAANVVPDDATALLERIENYFPKDDAVKTAEMFFELAEKDPEFFMQIIAMQTLIGVVDTPIAETHVGDALRQIREASNDEEREQLTNELFGRIKSLNAESKPVFLSEMQSLTTDDKKQLLSILNKK
jgi:hypothetical protein